MVHKGIQRLRTLFEGPQHDTVYLPVLACDQDRAGHLIVAEVPREYANLLGFEIMADLVYRGGGGGGKQSFNATETNMYWAMADSSRPD